MIDYSKVTDIEIEGIDHSDYPDFCDAYISRAKIDGIEATEDELEEIGEDSSWVHDKVMNQLF